MRLCQTPPNSTAVISDATSKATSGRFTAGLVQGSISATAAVLAWLPTQAIGLREGFWAAITAVAVAQTEFDAATSTARDQFAGAAIGGAVAAGVSLFVAPGAVGLGISVVIAILAFRLFDMVSAALLGGITSVIIPALRPNRAIGDRQGVRPQSRRVA